MSRTHIFPTLFLFIQSLLSKLNIFFYIFQAANAKPQWSSATSKVSSAQSTTQKAATSSAKVINETKHKNPLDIFS
jgi:hypothetical protein